MRCSLHRLLRFIVDQHFAALQTLALLLQLVGFNFGVQFIAIRFLQYFLTLAARNEIFLRCTVELFARRCCIFFDIAMVLSILGKATM